MPYREFLGRPQDIRKIRDESIEYLKEQNIIEMEEARKWAKEREKMYEDIEKREEPEEQFKVGDRVELIGGLTWGKEIGDIGEIIEIENNLYQVYFGDNYSKKLSPWYFKKNLRLIKTLTLQDQINRLKEKQDEILERLN